MATEPHLPVLYQEIITALQPHSSGRFVDGTLGAGGHAAGLLEISTPHGQLLGLDVDPQALAIAHKKLERFGERVHLRQASYLKMAEEARLLNWENVDCILLDLGVSSMQIDTPERGFSFLHDGPLDMRFSPRATHSAEHFVNTLDENELAEIIFRFGEERLSRRIAKAILQARPIKSTKQLADLIQKNIGRPEKIHPATRTFQALRIAVNEELDAVEKVLPIATQLLKKSGKLAIISFHSLEDRLVKEYFRRESKDCICPPRQPICTCGHKASVKELTRKPIIASEEEIKRNSRARSAKLRIVERI